MSGQTFSEGDGIDIAARLRQIAWILDGTVKAVTGYRI
jgi:hypothetical protein